MSIQSQPESSVLNNEEIMEKLRELTDENLDFTTNVNSIVGNLGPKQFSHIINMVNMSLYILQKKGGYRDTVMITGVVNMMLKHNHDKLESPKDPLYQINRAEIISLLYYIENNMETIAMSLEGENVPTWSIRADIFEKLSTDELDTDSNPATVK